MIYFSQKMYICAMFMKIRTFGFTGLFFILIFSSCGEFNKILKSTDYEFKYKKAIEYYNDGEYARASQLWEELVNIYRGTSRADEVYYYYAKSQFGMKDYLMSGHYFNTLKEEFPKSEHAEEAEFMVGYCYYLESPSPRLDQTTTQKAIDAFQLFINLNPHSDRVEEANRLIIELRDKLVYKSYLNGKLYYDLDYYNAAVVALTNSLKDFPDTRYREELMFMLLKSKYLLATKSIEEKKDERLNSALDEFYAFKDEYPNSENMKDAEKYHKTLIHLLHYKEN